MFSFFYFDVEDVADPGQGARRDRIFPAVPAFLRWKAASWAAMVSVSLAGSSMRTARDHGLVVSATGTALRTARTGAVTPLHAGLDLRVWSPSA